jgi:hypothetical protein
MPHTRSKKKKANSRAANGAREIVHTRRQQVEDEEGWTHVIDSPRRVKVREVPERERWHVGDFERGGVGYVNRTMGELGGDLGFYSRLWEGSGACGELRGRLEGKGKGRGRGKVGGVVCLGLGSLQSARREGRRASWTQLVALRTIMETLGMSFSYVGVFNS